MVNDTVKDTTDTRRARTEIGLRNINNDGMINYNIQVADGGRSSKHQHLDQYQDQQLDQLAMTKSVVETETETDSDLDSDSELDYGWEPFTRRSTLHMLTVTLKLIRDRALAGDDDSDRHRNDDAFIQKDITATTSDYNAAIYQWKDLLVFARETKIVNKNGGAHKMADHLTGTDSMSLSQFLTMSSSESNVTSTA